MPQPPSAFVLWAVVVLVVGSSAGAQPATATHIPGFSFLDDFNDMNISDDMPVSWTGFGAGQILNVSSGDLILVLTG